MNALAITDHGNLYGAVEFLREAKDAGVKPILGLRGLRRPGRRTERTTGGASGKEHAFHLTLLARNAEGFRTCSGSRPSLPRRVLLQAADRQGNPAAAFRRHHLPVGLRLGRVLGHLLHGKTAEAERLCAWYPKIFGEGLLHRDPGRRHRNPARLRRGALELARRMGLPLVATNDAHYLTREDAAAHDVLLCVNTQDGRATRTG